MKATEELKHEHDAILLVLDLADAMIRQENPDRADLRNLVEFFGEFVDHCHHAKEEDMLFPLLHEHNSNAVAKLIQTLEQEHEQGRIIVRAMRTSLEKDSDTGPLEPGFIDALKQYRELLEKHIDKENNELFSITNTALGEDTQQKLKQRFDRHEEEEMGHGRHEEFHAMIDHWREIYG